MESPRATFTLGPLEISFARRDDTLRLGIFVSLAVHLLFIVLSFVGVPGRRAVTEAELSAQSKPPVPISFVDPQRTRPQPRPDEIASRKPPSTTAAKPLRMQPVPEITGALKRPPKDQTQEQAGRRDERPAGGEQGGPKTLPTPGVPLAQPDGSEQQARDDSKDLLGRLREFKRAVETARPSSPKGPQGGGRGSGGVTMPDLPSTGFGVGNLEFEGRDYDWANYGRQIHGIIWRAWHNRLLITSSVFERWAAENRNWMLDHRNGVRFTILKTGQVVDVAIETPSGCYPLDDSATDALKEVVLPPLPEDFQRESEVVHARFIAEGEIRTMKAFLRQMKDAGFF